MAEHEQELIRLCKEAINEVVAADVRKFQVLPEAKIRPRVVASVQDSLRRAVGHHQETPPTDADGKLGEILAANHVANVAQFFVLARVSQELADKIAALIVNTSRG